MVKNITRLTVNIPENEYNELKALADESNLSFTQQLRQAIAHETFLAEKIKGGSSILVKDRNSEISQELVFGFPGKPARV